jgi:hypothetical protein
MQADVNRGVSGVSMPSPSKLEQVMDVDALADKSGEELADIWIKVRMHGGRM